MKIQKLLLIVALLLFVFSASAQENSTPIKRISLGEVQIQSSLLSGGYAGGTLADFQTLSPGSVLLNNDFSSFSQSSSGFGFSSFNFNSSFSAMIGIRFSDKEKTTYKNPVLRLGVNYCRGISLIGSMYKSETTTFDTIVSSQSGETIGYIDSISSESYSMNYTGEQLRFDGSLIFRTNPNGRWSLFTGFGFTFGMSFNANTSVYYTSSVREQMVNVDGQTLNYYSPGDYESASEHTINKPNLGASAYLPMGVDFRLGKKNEFLKQIHLFYELRPGVNMTSIPELRTFISASFQQGLGIRVTW